MEKLFLKNSGKLKFGEGISMKKVECVNQFVIKFKIFKSEWLPKLEAICNINIK